MGENVVKKKEIPNIKPEKMAYGDFCFCLQNAI